MSSIARLKVVLDGVEPKVVRRFEVPVTMRLSRLHTVLQIMMGWTDTHLYEFTFRGSGYGIPDPDWETDCADARSASVTAHGVGKKVLRGDSEFDSSCG